MKTYNWGYMGLGYIAEKTIPAFDYIKNARVLAVASNTPAKAAGFCAKHGVERAYTTYDALVSDPDIDAVYIATPNGMHLENALLAIEHGKAVLCEKPFAMNARQAEEMARAAREKGVFLMDGMWSRFFPAMYKLRELLKDGVIGPVRNITADHSYRWPYDPNYHLYDPKMGGGTLMDGGIYPLALACMVYGALPNRCVGLANLRNGVDVQSDAIIGFENGGMAALITGTDAWSPWDCALYGEKGRITIPKFAFADTFEVWLDGEDKPSVYSYPYDKPGYQFEFMHVADCLDKGLRESPIMPLDETVGIMRTMDELRRQWGVVYPAD